jgi:formamidopyrimidine-DNA glycosylase
MVAGRLRWLEEKAKPPGRITLALLEFESGTLAVTEAGTKRRASLHLVEGADALQAMDPGGLEIANLDLRSFSSQLKKENHTLKRALADPCSASATPTTRPTTARAARPAASCWRTARCRAC